MDSTGVRHSHPRRLNAKEESLTRAKTAIARIAEIDAALVDVLQENSTSDALTIRKQPASSVANLVSKSTIGDSKNCLYLTTVCTISDF